MDAESKDKLEYEWVKCWRGTTGTKIPRQVLQAYVNLLDITRDELDNQLCWECWSDKDAQEAVLYAAYKCTVQTYFLVCLTKVRC